MPKPKKINFPETEYWPFSHMRAWDPDFFLMFAEELFSFKGAPYNNDTKIQFMKNLEKRGFYERKSTKATDEDYLKRFGSYVSLIFFFGLGVENEKGLFPISEMCEYFVESQNAEQFLKLQMKKFQYPHGSLQPELLKKWKASGKEIVPLPLILEVLMNLPDKPLKKHLTKSEILFHIQTASSNNDVGRIVKKICDDRKKGKRLNIKSLPKKVVDELNRLFPCFSGTRLLEYNNANEEKTVFFQTLKQYNDAKSFLESGYKYYNFKNKREWLEYYGYKPKVDDGLVEQISRVTKKSEFYNTTKKIKKVDYNPEELLRQLDRRAIGKHRNKKAIIHKKQRLRSTGIYELIKNTRKFRCQYCEKPSFTDKNGNNYVVVHHMIEYNDEENGPDRQNNIIVLCPNCHSMFHHSDPNAVNRFYKNLRKKGELSFRQFLELKKDKDIGEKQFQILFDKGIITAKELEILKSKEKVNQKTLAKYF